MHHGFKRCDMTKTFTLLLLILVYLNVSAQDSMVKGRLLDKDGNPLPGVNVVIKGTQTGTVTDLNGYYQIRARAGAILVFSFVGMTIREVLVTPGMMQDEPLLPLYSPAEEEVLATFLPKQRDTLGVAVLRDSTARYKIRGKLVPRQIASFKETGPDEILIKSIRDPMLSEEIKFQFTTDFSVMRVNRMPLLQNTYTQGLPMNGTPVWAGPDSRTPFSWGPDISLLEFEPVPYPWDKNGPLMFRSGTGSPAQAYENSSFLQTASAFGNELVVSVPSGLFGNFTATLSHNREEYIIPGSDRQHIQTMVKASRLQSGALEFGGNLLYRRTEGSLWPHGASLARVMAGILTSPVSFDLTNGLSSYRAARSSESYLFADGSERNFSPDFNNPFGLIQELPDHDRQQELMGRIGVMFDHSPAERNHSVWGNLTLFGDFSSLTSVFGLPEFYRLPGRQTKRDDDQLHAGSELTTGYNYRNQNLQWEITGKYLPGVHKLWLDRTDLFEDSMEPDSSARQDQTVSRMQHEIILKTTLEYDWVQLTLANQFYMSSTAPSAYTFLPQLGLELDLGKLINSYTFNRLNVFYHFSLNVREGALLQTEWARASLNKPVDRFQDVYESDEVFFHPGLTPEIHTDSEWGFSGDIYPFIASVRMYHERITDFIVYDPFQSSLINAGEEIRKGVEMQLDYHSRYYSRLTAGITFAAWDAQVRSLRTEYQIPLAGFDAVTAQLAEDSPTGALFGHTYKRNEAGRLIIGADGFPIEDQHLKRLANPIPDWQMGMHSSLQLNKLTFRLALLGQRGGNKWNGTRAYLDYLGKSLETGELRYTSQYVFDGVMENGQPNITPVSYYDPSQPLNENRWVRYGPDGVAEDYIEDTSWLRIQEISIRYSLNNLSLGYLDEIDLIASAENILLYSAYNGVDPESALFGYEPGAALDLFNVPSTFRFMAKVIIKF